MKNVIFSSGVIDVGVWLLLFAISTAALAIVICWMWSLWKRFSATTAVCGCPVFGATRTDERVKDAMLEIYRKTPFYGIPRLTAELKRRGYRVNHKWVRRLQKSLNLRTV